MKPLDVAFMQQWWDKAEKDGTPMIDEANMTYQKWEHNNWLVIEGLRDANGDLGGIIRETAFTKQSFVDGQIIERGAKQTNLSK